MRRRLIEIEKGFNYNIVKLKKYLLLIILLCCLNLNTLAIENKILFKIDSEIITSIQVYKYSRYLTALDENIKNLNNEEIFEFTKNLIVKEKIKKIKLKNEGIILDLDEKILDNYIKSIFSVRGINNFAQYKKFLENLEMNVDDMKEKLIINLLWNNLIFKKFSSNIKINKNNLKKQIKNQNNTNSISYLLSEIFFEASNVTEVKKKSKEINAYIERENFKKAALIYSKSDSAKDGGNIGWISTSALNKNILEAISKLRINDISNPISVPGGFLILKLDNKKLIKNDFNLDKEVEKLIKIKTNQQLTQFSNIYFNKVKKEILINEF